MTRKRIGNQRPTKCEFRPYKNNIYQEVVELYQKTERTVFEWQINLLKPMMALNEDGLWTHTKFGYSLPRRNGKNEVVAMREMWGLMQGENILHTAHRTTTSHTAWERLLNLFDKAKIEYSSLRSTGRERIEIPKTGGRIEFRTCHFLACILQFTSTPPLRFLFFLLHCIFAPTPYKKV
ncbi:MAG: hypothetical protein ACOXZ0_03185 [Eubacteriales bacterium]|jgi:hypothetical protein